MLGADFFAHAFQPRTQRSQHGLLTFDRRGALRQVRLGAAMFLFCLPDLRFFPTQIIVKRCQRLRLLFHLPASALQLFALMIDFASPILQLLLTLFQAGLKSIEPNQIVLILFVKFLQFLLALS